MDGIGSTRKMQHEQHLEFNIKGLIMATHHNDNAAPAATGDEMRAQYGEDLPAISNSNVEVGTVTQVAINGDATAGRLVLTEEQIRQLGIMAEIGLSVEEMMTILGVCKSRQTLINRYGDIIEQGQSRGNYMLRRRQYDVAMAGDVKMLVWLGKTRLGQRETTEVITKQVLPWGDDLNPGAVQPTIQ